MQPCVCTKTVKSPVCIEDNQGVAACDIQRDSATTSVRKHHARQTNHGYGTQRLTRSYYCDVD
ncbi:Uncharacterised protein [Vibrio cholerae]|nr:Uncharacterised protein [Vibrio cholerae]CSI72461.1 Uncharacterised protein [Vibrio cholerae]